jgi:hypothetical protein
MPLLEEFHPSEKTTAFNAIAAMTGIAIQAYMDIIDMFIFIQYQKWFKPD